MIFLGIFFGIQRSHGKNHVAITGMAGISGMKMRTSIALALTRFNPCAGVSRDYKAAQFLVVVNRRFHSEPHCELNGDFSPATSQLEAIRIHRNYFWFSFDGAFRINFDPQPDQSSI